MTGHMDLTQIFDKEPTVSNPVEVVTMCAFLAQFKSKNNWSVMGKDVIGREYIDLAKEMGLVASWKPPKGSTYRASLVCTLKGRLYIRKNA